MTNNKWTSPPATSKLNPKIHKIIKTPIIVQSILHRPFCCYLFDTDTYPRKKIRKPPEQSLYV